MSSDLGRLESQLEDMNAPVIWEHNIPQHGENYFGPERIPIEQTPMCNGNKDVEVDIIGNKYSGKDFMVQDSCDDITECSSSFDDTGSGSENAIAVSFDDQEVESQMCADIASSSMCDDWHEPLRTRKKMATDHWRKFISPIMQRCKWLELQMIQLKSQERKYCEELAKINCTKQLDYAHLTFDGSDVKSVPISGRMHRNKVMKRRKRERVEENCDLASYMSNHSLFSYYEKEDHNVDFGLKDCHEVTVGADSEDAEGFKLNDLFFSVDNDNSWYDIIQKIEAIQARVQNLKNRHDKVISENPGRFCSVNQLSMVGPTDGLDHFDLKPDSFSGNASSANEIVPFIEPTDKPELDDPQENTMDENLTQYEIDKEKLHELEDVGNDLVEKIRSIEDITAISEAQVAEHESFENVVHNLNAHSTLKSCSTLKPYILRNKSKRNKKNGS